MPSANRQRPHPRWAKRPRHKLRHRKEPTHDLPVEHDSHGASANDQPPTCLGVAARDHPGLPDRRLHREPDCRRGRLGRRGASRRPDRGRGRRRRTVARAPAGRPLDLDRSHQHRNGRRSHPRRRTRRLRDRPGGPHADGCRDRSRCRRAAGGGARTTGHLRCGLVGGSEPASLGACLAGELVRDHREHRRALHELRREWLPSVRPADRRPARDDVPPHRGPGATP